MSMPFGDSVAGVWLSEAMNKCVRDSASGRAVVDMNLLTHLCRLGPKSAQVAMQILARELRDALHGSPVAEARGIAVDWRLLLGSIYAAYCLSRECVDGIPPEIQFIVRMYPEVMDSFIFVMAGNASRLHELSEQMRKARPWWQFW